MIEKSKRLLIKFFVGVLSLCGMPHADSVVWQSPPFEIPGDDDAIFMSQASNDGHVMLLRRDNDDDLSAFYYTNGAWVFSDTLLTNPIFLDTFEVAMSPSGKALAIFDDNGTNSVRSKYFNGSTWITPSPNPLDTLTGGPSNFAVGVAMNGADQGVGAWSDGINMRAAFFLNGAWTFSQIIGVSSYDVDVAFAYSINGAAIALWYDSGLGLFVINNFNGITWQPGPQPIIPSTNSDVGINANGIAYVIWENGDDISVTPFNAVTSTILPVQTISTGLGNTRPSIGVAPNGTAVAVWIDGANAGQSSIFNGSVWSPPIPFSTDVDSDPKVSVDTNGNAIVVWQPSSGEILASRLPLGGVWGPVELVAEATSEVQVLYSALSANGIGFAAWITGDEENPEGFANASLLPTPPLAIFGSHCENRFVTQTECVNIITWIPSTDPTVVAYYLYRNGILIAVIPASGPFIYEDHNTGNKTDVYSLTAVDAQGLQSPPVVVVISH